MITDSTCSPSLPTCSALAKISEPKASVEAEAYLEFFSSIFPHARMISISFMFLLFLSSCESIVSRMMEFLIVSTLPLSCISSRQFPFQNLSSPDLRFSRFLARNNAIKLRNEEKELLSSSLISRFDQIRAPSDRGSSTGRKRSGSHSHSPQASPRNSSHSHPTRSTTEDDSTIIIHFSSNSKLRHSQFLC